MRELKHTALTHEALVRLTWNTRPDELDGHEELVEHLAYCACMGAESFEEAWRRLAELVERELGIHAAERHELHSIILTVHTSILGHRVRGHWNNGVLAYADELLDKLFETVVFDDVTPADIGDRARLEKCLLNGARDWREYSYSASALVCDLDIAERLLCPSELKRKRGGELEPGGGKTWLDVQARALYQACRIICDAMTAYAKERR